MKRIMFVLPLSVLLTYCSSSKHAATIPAGVSNVQVNGANNTNVTNTGTTGRDWGYSSSRDTAMNGTWALEGMAAADGSWKGAEAWAPVDTTMNNMETAGNTAGMSTSGSGAIGTGNGNAGMNASGSTTGTTTNASATKQKNPDKGKSFSQALFDTSTHFFDTLAFQQTLANRETIPFHYWQRLPEMKIMANLGIFTGNTGCNSMSGSFNFKGNEFKVDNRIRTSKMSCNEYDESQFISNLLKADSYRINNDMLEFRQGETTVLTFRKKS